MDIQILYDDNDIVAVNKPAGLIVHSDGRTKEPSLSDWILEHYPKTANVGEPMTVRDSKSKVKGVILRPGIVHRLDRGTSGVILSAKTKEGYQCLKKQFQSKEIKKTYHAFVYGEISRDEGKIDRPIGKSRSDFRLWSAQRGAKGILREAVTKYRVLARKGSFSFLELKPETGRTHQIRVHLKAINYPVVGDKLYAPNRSPALGFTRAALHATSIEFKNLSGETVRVEAPFPSDFQNALKFLKINAGDAGKIAN